MSNYHIIIKSREIVSAGVGQTDASCEIQEKETQKLIIPSADSSLPILALKFPESMSYEPTFAFCLIFKSTFFLTSHQNT